MSAVKNTMTRPDKVLSHVHVEALEKGALSRILMSLSPKCAKSWRNATGPRDLQYSLGLLQHRRPKAVERSVGFV